MCKNDNENPLGVILIYLLQLALIYGIWGEWRLVFDTTKQTLVVFSASWCAPCHALIPKLKEAYEKHKDKFEFVYVSIEDPETFDRWRTLMGKEQIPWRSLFIKQYAKDEAIYRDMIIPHIPYAMLVDGNMSMERIKISEYAVRDNFFKWLDEQ